jgi:hypothetical protein
MNKLAIGANVKYINDQEYTYVILALKDQSLTEEFLKSRNGKYSIQGIDKFAKHDLSVEKGYAFLIGQILSIDNTGKIKIGKLVNVHRTDISI